MSKWTDVELVTIERTDEIQVSSRRPDGSARGFVTMWMVRVGDDVFVRSARQVNPWFRRAIASGTGTIRVGSLTKEIAFETDPVVSGAEVDRAYHAKYDRYGSRIVDGVVGEDSYPRTLRLIPTA